MCATNYTLCRLLEMLEYGGLCEGSEVRSYTENIPFFEVRSDDGCLTFVPEICWSSRVVEDQKNAGAIGFYCESKSKKI